MFCFEPKEALKRAWFKLFSTPKRSQKRQHSESKMHVSRQRLHFVAESPGQAQGKGACSFFPVLVLASSRFTHVRVNQP